MNTALKTSEYELTLYRIQYTNWQISYVIAVNRNVFPSCRTFWGYSTSYVEIYAQASKISPYRYPTDCQYQHRHRQSPEVAKTIRSGCEAEFRHMLFCSLRLARHARIQKTNQALLFYLRNIAKFT